jgi:hypothetical protein
MKMKEGKERGRGVYSGTAVQRYSGTAVQRYSGTAVQRYSSKTVQRYSCCTLYVHIHSNYFSYCK